MLVDSSTFILNSGQAGHRFSHETARFIFRGLPCCQRYCDFPYQILKDMYLELEVNAEKSKKHLIMSIYSIDTNINLLSVFWSSR